MDNNYTRPKHKNNQPTNHKQKGHHFLEDLELEVDLEAKLDLERAKRAAEETPGGTCGAGCFGAFLPRAFDLDLEESSSEEAISDTSRFRATEGSAMLTSCVGALPADEGAESVGPPETRTSQASRTT